MAKTIDQVLAEYVSAGTPAIALRTSEETRALATLASVAEKFGRPLTVWNSREGLVNMEPREVQFTAEDFAGQKDVIRFPGACASAILDWLAAHLKRNEKEELYLPEDCWPGLVVFCDLHPWLKDLDPPSERALRDLVACAGSNGMVVVFLGCQFTPPPSFARYVTVLDYKLPDEDALNGILANIELSCKERNIKLVAPENGQRQALIRAATGLTCHEAEQAYSLAVARAADPDKPKAPRTLDPVTVAAEKALAIKRSGLLEIIEPDARGLEAVGGLTVLKRWLQERKLAYSRAAQEYKLPGPRGALLVGQPGCGKSLTAKCVGTIFGIPTLRWDIGKAFGSLVGESEARTDEVLSMVDAVSPCALWIDEVEKGLQGTHGGASHDSGTGARVLGKLLYWMEERTSEVFIVATCNEPWLLPAPFVQRFEETWYIDLPSEREAAEILAVHLSRLGRDAKKFNLPKVAAACKDYSGRELVAVLTAAMYRAFYDSQREISTEDLLACAAEKRKTSSTMAEQYKLMLEFGRRCRRASDEKEAPTKADVARRIMTN